MITVCGVNTETGGLGHSKRLRSSSVVLTVNCEVQSHLGEFLIVAVKLAWGHPGVDVLSPYPSSGCCINSMG